MTKKILIIDDERTQAEALAFKIQQMFTDAETIIASSEKEIESAIVEKFYNLAILDINRAKGLQDEFSNIQNWYIAGHSLGGALACSYLANNLEDYVGLILLGSYSTEDFSDTDLNILSIYGENDKILNKAKYEKYKTNIDDKLIEKIIPGGNHSYFGMYGNQMVDGDVIITNREQIKLTVDYIINFIFE